MKDVKETDQPVERQPRSTKIAIIGFLNRVRDDAALRPLVRMFARRARIMTLGRGSHLTMLETNVLLYLTQRKTVDDIVTRTGVAPTIISRKIDILHRKGFATEGSFLTEKGFEALNRPYRA